MNQRCLKMDSFWVIRIFYVFLNQVLSIMMFIIEGIWVKCFFFLEPTKIQTSQAHANWIFNYWGMISVLLVIPCNTLTFSSTYSEFYLLILVWFAVLLVNFSKNFWCYFWVCLPLTLNFSSFEFRSNIKSELQNSKESIFKDISERDKTAHSNDFWCK